MSSLFTTLKNGRKIPTIGFGCYAITGTEAVDVFTKAAKCGYRQFDCASMYKNEKEVGTAILSVMKSDGIPRSEFFYTTKAWTSEQGTQLSSNIDKAIERCGLGYIDLMLLHWPSPDKKVREDSWKALAEAVKDGKLKQAGVSNYNKSQIEEIYALKTGIDPVINQIEINPWVQDAKTIQYCHGENIVLQAYGPLARASNLDDPTLKQVAEEVSKTPAQVLVRWSIQKGYVPLPKSSNEERMRKNLDVEGFELSKANIESLDSLAR
ncbi:protein of unknown function [Taphrina deformans PYCC 5710]|uniref:NADP-dependent oxidoreductase domain-containing protein n=1 Tax=Taphrina deformans (strain PYCC 5710 / ATCC 11124 / CBS 356.35 / IMI 108563 / JCM 9778 / NBRC 8474) TaxID=1097556 RepID=R4XHQ9_TAPDE|nr:protein of unknown function [Taphrina deformans PYCC 5710]|eukprot:CCG84053.1 protein of unknown function [Taphrina deformans PYCC 5710]